MSDSAPIFPRSTGSGSAGFLSSILHKLQEQGSPHNSSDSSPSEQPPCDIAPKELPTGHRLHGYCLLRCLGAGGFGISYLAQEEILKRRVVIKEHFPDSICHRRASDLHVCLSNREQEETYQWAKHNFLREARILASLSHPNIAKTYTFFETLQSAYYVTEYIDGQSLADLLNDYHRCGQHISQESLYSLIIHLLDALDYIHKRQILHCDIKPDNILLRRNGQAVLIDFGAAQEKQVQLGSGMVETVGFSPSEQCAEGGQLGPWTDLYALGACLHYLLKQENLPCCRQRELCDSVSLLEQDPRLRRHYHPRLLRSIDRAIHPAINDRYPSAAAWIADLRF